MASHSDFEKGLNQHGYAFHQRVLEEIVHLGVTDPEPLWSILAVELPVVAGDTSTRIDFVLEASDDPGERHLLVGECKRVNPEYSSWCFAKAPYSSPRWAATQLIAETITNLQVGRPIAAGAGGAVSDRFYQIGFVLKTDRQGDKNPVSPDKDAIEASCMQVMKGVNGLAELLMNEERLRPYLEGRHFVQVLPVIVTTAELFVTTADLRRASLDSGQIELAREEVKPIDWLYYQYPQSPRYKHSIARGSLSQDKFEDLAGRDYVRTVAVVTPRGLPDFLKTGWLELATYSRRVAERDGVKVKHRRPPNTGLRRTPGGAA